MFKGFLVPLSLSLLCSLYLKKEIGSWGAVSLAPLSSDLEEEEETTFDLYGLVLNLRSANKNNAYRNAFIFWIFNLCWCVAGFAAG